MQNRTVTHGDSGNRNVDTVVGPLANKDFVLAYDATDRLVEVSNAGVPLGAYLHNAMGQRVSKTVGVDTTHYLYDLSGRLIAEADGATGAVSAEYIAFEGINLAFVTTTGIYWIHADHLGTPQVLTDGTGAPAWEAAYDPFGAATVTGTLTFNPRFPGQYHDRETGYYYNYFRTYDPANGRYVESDPIGLRGGWNTYGYVGGNPMMFVDPKGLKIEICCRSLKAAPKYLHCYIKVDGIFVYGLYPQWQGSDQLGVPFTDDPRDAGGSCVSCSSPKCLPGGNDRACIESAFGNYPRGIYDLTGPNSNTFAAKLWGCCCGDPFPSQFQDAAVGWGYSGNPRSPTSPRD